MFEHICRCIKGSYKGLEFKFNATDLVTYNNTQILFFKSQRELSDFIIKLFLNNYMEREFELSITDYCCTLKSDYISIEKAVI